MSVLLAFAAALADALNMVTQHVASTASPAGKGAWRLARYLVRNPLWLFGVIAMLGAFVLQALALYHGRLSVVQSIMVTTLIFTLVIGSVWLHREVRAAAWVSASVTTVGLVVFLVMSEPHGGHPAATRQAWFVSLAVSVAAVGAMTLLAMSGSPVRRAALFAASSGIAGALCATFMKDVADEVSRSGLLPVLLSWELYGLIVAGGAGVVLTQAALHSGPLAVSQPLMVIVNPVFSIVLGVVVFGEQFSGGTARIVFGVGGFAAMVVGAFFLGRTAPSLASEPSPERAGTAGAPGDPTG